MDGDREMATLLSSFAVAFKGLCLRGDFEADFKGDFETFLANFCMLTLLSFVGGMKPSCEIGVVGFFIYSGTTFASVGF